MFRCGTSGNFPPICGASGQRNWRNPARRSRLEVGDRWILGEALAWPSILVAERHGTDFMRRRKWYGDEWRVASGKDEN